MKKILNLLDTLLIEINPLDNMLNFTAFGIDISDAPAAAAYLFLLDLFSSSRSAYLVWLFDLSFTNGGGLLEVLALLLLDVEGTGEVGDGVRAAGEEGEGGDCGYWRLARLARAPGEGVMDRRFTEWR